MTLLTLLSLSLLAAEPSPPTLATGSFNFVGISEEMQRFVPEQIAQRITLDGVRVITQREVGALLGVERQRQLLGCSDAASSCLAELAGALGADGVLLGDLAKVGGIYQLNLKVVSSSGKMLAVSSNRIRQEELLLESLDAAATAIAHSVRQSLGREARAPEPVAAAPQAAPPPPPAALERSAGPAPARSPALITLGASAVPLAAGITFLLLAEDRHQKLTQPPPDGIPRTDGPTLRRQGETFQTLGYAGLGLGVAGAAVGTWLLLRPAPVQPLAWVAPGGAGLAVQGAFP